MQYSRYLTDGTETDEVQEPENFSGRRREYLEFGYVRETYTDSQDIPHIRIFHEKTEAAAGDLWEVSGKT